MKFIKIHYTRIRIDSILSYTPYFYPDGCSLSIYEIGGGHKFYEFDFEDTETLKEIVKKLDDSLL